MKIVIIGNGMAGYKFCEKIIAKAPDSELVIFGEEIRPAYDRVHLSEYFAGKSANDLTLAGLDWYQDNNITLHLGDPVQGIDQTAKQSTLIKELLSFMTISSWLQARRHLSHQYRVSIKKAYIYIEPSKTLN